MTFIGCKLKRRKEKLTTPNKSEILEKAKELFFNSEWKNGNRTPINPSEQELRELGYISLAQSMLMTNIEREHAEYLHNADTVQNMIKDKHVIPLDLSECKKSNILISGTNQQGKSLCAMGISDILMNHGFQIIAFDSCGNWKSKSSIPNIVIVKDKDTRLNAANSVVFDLSLLKLRDQKKTIESFLERLWLLKVVTRNQKWTLCIFEEFQMLAKNLRGAVTQNLLRIMSVGANWKIRCLGITPDLALIDPCFIRLCQQRFHFRLGNEPNAKRRFRSYYGLDWSRVTQNLDVGFAVYVNKDKLEVWKIPMFQPRLKVTTQ